MFGNRPPEKPVRRRFSYIQTIHFPKHFTQWDKRLLPPVWAAVRLSTGESISSKFRYLSRESRYSFQFDEYDSKYHSWKATVLTCDGMPEEEDPLERILCHRADAKLDDLSESIRERLLGMMLQAPWLFCFPWSHPYADIVKTPTLQDVFGWHSLPDTERSALKCVEKYIDPEFKKGHVYLRSNQVKQLHGAMRTAVLGPLGLLKEIEENGELHYYSQYTLSAQKSIVLLEQRAFQRQLQAPPRGLPITSSLCDDPDQLAAVECACTKRKVIIMGGAGTGKTTICSELARQFGAEHVLFVAFTGRAAQRLEEVVGLGRTIHSLTFVHKYLEHEPDSAEECHVVVIDEMSMVGLHLYADLLECLPNVERIIMVGDAEQLRPIERGCPFVANLRRYFPLDTPREVGLARGIIRLRTDHRTHPEAARLAENHMRILLRHCVLIAERGAESKRNAAGHPCHILRRSSMLFEDIVVFFSEQGRSYENAQFLTHTRALAFELNEEIARNEHREFAKALEVAEKEGKRPRKEPKTPKRFPIFVGDKIIFKKNHYGANLPKEMILDMAYSYSSKVMNGTLDFVASIVDVTGAGTAKHEHWDEPLSSPGAQRWIITRKGRQIFLHSEYYSKWWIERGYAVTITSYQGAEVDYVGLYMEHYLNHCYSHFSYRDFYVAYTRAIRGVDIFLPAGDYRENALKQVIQKNWPFGAQDAFECYLPAAAKVGEAPESEV